MIVELIRLCFYVRLQPTALLLAIRSVKKKYTSCRSYEYDDKGRPLMDSPNARAMMSVLKRLNVRGKTEVSRADLAKVRSYHSTTHCRERNIIL